MAKKKLDLIGQTFDRLTVLKEAGQDKFGKTQWLCLCTCGTTKTVTGSKLKSGHTRSCGCLSVEVSRSKSLGDQAKAKHPLYGIWQAMKTRCLNPNHERFPSYGARGVKICSRWMDFNNFVEDMGPRPSPSHTIDRKDVNGNYEPSNCRWATRKEQQNNRRDSIQISFEGKVQTLTQWEVELGFNRGTIQSRLARGWSFEEALSTPSRSYKRPA